MERLLLRDGLLLEEWHDLYSEGAVVLAEKIDNPRFSVDMSASASTGLYFFLEPQSD